jgi:hypothetical protein
MPIGLTRELTITFYARPSRARSSVVWLFHLLHIRAGKSMRLKLAKERNHERRVKEKSPTLVRSSW